MTEIFLYLFQIEIRGTAAAWICRFVRFSIALKQETGCPFFSADEAACKWRIRSSKWYSEYPFPRDILEEHAGSCPEVEFSPTKKEKGKENADSS
jgi:hypothetical protein